MADLACGGREGPGGREGDEHSVLHVSRWCRWCKWCRRSRNHLYPAWAELLLVCQSTGSVCLDLKNALFVFSLHPGELHICKIQIPKSSVG